MTAPDVIPENEWRWCGYPGHFVAARNCRFHLTTRVGDWLVSTVGDYRPPGRDSEPQEIGVYRLYETYVFPAIDHGECHAGVMADAVEVDSEGYVDSFSAERGHMEKCREVAQWGDAR